MDFKIKALRYFVAVAEEGSITQAAEKLNIAQPSLSQRIRSLEEFLGLSLFIRSHGQVHLSQEGTLFLPIARELVQAAAAAGAEIRNWRDGSSGTLRIGGSWFTLQQPDASAIIEDFAEQNSKVELVVHRESFSHSLLSRVSKGDLDVAIVSGPVTGPQFETISLMPVRLNLLLPSEHPAARLTELPIAKLDALRVAWYQYHEQLPPDDAIVQVHQYLESVGAEIIVPPDTIGGGLVRFAQRHRVATLIPSYPVQDFGDMVQVTLEGYPAAIETSVVKLKSDQTAPVKRFWTFSQRFLKRDC